MVEEKRERKQNNDNNNKQTHSEKKEEAGTVSEQRDKGWIHVIRVHDTTHLAVTTTLRGSRHSWDYPPHLYIVNAITPETNGEERGKKQSMARTGSTPNHNPGRPQNHVYWTRTNKTFSSLRMMKQTRINWENKIKTPNNSRLPNEV